MTTQACPETIDDKITKILIKHGLMKYLDDGSEPDDNLEYKDDKFRKDIQGLLDGQLAELKEASTRYVRAHAYSGVRLQDADGAAEYREAEDELAELLGLHIDKDETA